MFERRKNPGPAQSTADTIHKSIVFGRQAVLHFNLGVGTRIMGLQSVAPGSLTDSALKREARQLRELAAQVRHQQPEHAASCEFAAAMIESMLSNVESPRVARMPAKRRYDHSKAW